MADYLPIPAADPTDINSHEHNTSEGLTGGQTFSHTLASDKHDEDGLAQQPHDKQVLDLGWNEKKQDIASPLIGGLDNEELWLLVRRFNKVS